MGKSIKIFLSLSLLFATGMFLFLAFQTIGERFSVGRGERGVIRQGAEGEGGEQRDLVEGKIMTGKLDGEGNVLGEAESGFEIYASEKYSSPLVSLGGDISIYPGDEEQLKISEYDVRSELMKVKTKDEIRMLVSWKTNKQAKCKLKFGKRGDETGKTIEEEKHGYVHSALLNNLMPSSAYTFEITSRDKWGNENVSEKYAFYTGEPEISMMDLLMQAVQDVFGWAIKK